MMVKFLICQEFTFKKAVIVCKKIKSRNSEETDLSLESDVSADLSGTVTW